MLKFRTFYLLRAIALASITFGITSPSPPRSVSA